MRDLRSILQELYIEVESGDYHEAYKLLAVINNGEEEEENEEGEGGNNRRNVNNVNFIQTVWS